MLPLVFIFFYNRDAKGVKRTRTNHIVHLAVQSICVLVALVNLLNALDIGFHREPGPVLLGLLIGLGTAMNLFSRLLLTPIKKMIDQQGPKS